MRKVLFQLLRGVMKQSSGTSFGSYGSYGSYGSLAPQRGMAILMAMMTLALVATLSAGVLWQQWRAQEKEAISRFEQQGGLLLGAALDWARIILTEDSKASNTDSNAEPWSIPLQETQLSAFLAAGANGEVTQGEASELEDQTKRIYLSGRITDLQSKLNLFNLVNASQVSVPDLNAFTQLFTVLGLPQEQLQLIIQGLSGGKAQSFGVGTLTASSQQQQSANVAPVFIYASPQRIEQLNWLGVAPQTLSALAPYVTWLPARTLLNLNTASAQVMSASFPALSLDNAEKVVQLRDAQPWKTLDAATTSINSIIKGSGSGPNSTSVDINSTQFALNSNYFLVIGRIRYDSLIFTERSVLQRNNQQTNILWREKRASGAEPGCFSTIEPPC